MALKGGQDEQFAAGAVVGGGAVVSGPAVVATVNAVAVKTGIAAASGAFKLGLGLASINPIVGGVALVGGGIYLLSKWLEK